MLTEQEKNRRTAEQLRLMDDDFLRLYFNNNKEGIEFLLRIILKKPDLKVIRSETQCEYRSLSERSITIDIYAVDSSGKVYNIEVQRDDSGADPKRVRFHSSMLDTKLLKKNEKFDKLAETFVIFITENDIFDCGLPLYEFDRYCKNIDRYLNDGAHIIYVNGAYQNPNDSIGRLMHDFKCVHADEMYSLELKERFRYFKETEGGMGEMCKLIEQRINEEKIESIKSLLMLGKLTHEEIANSLKVPVEFVKDIASGKVA